ncbi:HHL105Wp [Eremothecium sinecaudum]|uniref:HHL105Wp n=1 Tax=Eremothecium sinecaudum TaxID=45286 RepID=A0A120K2U5_9SACH|nr:HHL105Wp [Eremothecium sinecaudum]AMD22665.1 HHL105Wp [Eremothecium sinecaudum]
MNQTILKKLAKIVPSPEPIDPREAPHKDRPLILDDSQPNAPDRHRYVTDLNVQYHEEDVKADLFLMKYTQGLQRLENQGYVDITSLAFWKPSSFKAGYPIENALDDNPSTFWQSDGSQPHTIDVLFSKRVDIIQLAMYFSLFVDESYTSETIRLYAGHSPSDATYYKTLEVRNVNGWVKFTFEDNRADGLLKCQFLRIEVVTNHENGKDTHLRGIRMFGPGESLVNVADAAMFEGFHSIEFLSQSRIR